MGHKILFGRRRSLLRVGSEILFELSDYDVIHCTNGVDGFEAFRKKRKVRFVSIGCDDARDGWFYFRKENPGIGCYSTFVYITAKV